MNVITSCVWRPTLFWQPLSSCHTSIFLDKKLAYMPRLLHPLYWHISSSLGFHQFK